MGYWWNVAYIDQFFVFKVHIVRPIKYILTKFDKFLLVQD
jgi:hypothetical protein